MLKKLVVVPLLGLTCVVAVSAAPTLTQLAYRFTELHAFLNQFEQYSFTRPISYQEAEQIFGKSELAKVEYIYMGTYGDFQPPNLPSGHYRLHRQDIQGVKAMLKGYVNTSSKEGLAHRQEWLKLSENTLLIHTVLVVKGSPVKLVPYVYKSWERPKWVEDKYNAFYQKYHLR